MLILEHSLIIIAIENEVMWLCSHWFVKTFWKGAVINFSKSEVFIQCGKQNECDLNFDWQTTHSRGQFQVNTSTDALVKWQLRINCEDRGTSVLVHLSVVSDYGGIVAVNELSSCSYFWQQIPIILLCNSRRRIEIALCNIQAIIAFSQSFVSQKMIDIILILKES